MRALSGVADHYATDDLHALAIVRRIVGTLNTRKAIDIDLEEPADAALRGRRPRRHRADRPEEAVRHPRGDRALGRRLRVRRVQAPLRHDPGHGLCPHPRHPRRDPRQQRHPLFGERARRARISSSSCCQRRIPLLFLQNITGFMVGRDYEARGIAKDGAKLVTAVACARVPKITVIVGGSFGAGNYGMCGRAYQPRFLFTWPNSQHLGDGRRAGRERARHGAPRQHRGGGAELERRGGGGLQGADPRQATRRRAAPTTPPPASGTTASSCRRETRRVLALAFSATLNAPVEETRFGVFRM